MKPNGTGVTPSMKKWDSEMHKCWGIPAEGFKGTVQTDGSLLGTAGKWRACGWSVVQLDLDEELGPLHGMYGLMEAEFEFQRTMKRAELTAFLCLLKNVIGSIKLHVGNTRIVEGLWREEGENASIRKLAMLTCGEKIGRIALSSLKRNVGQRGACQGATHKE